MKKFNGFRLIDGTVDNSQCPHLHLIDYDGVLRCQTCGQAWETQKYIEIDQIKKGEHGRRPRQT